MRRSSAPRVRAVIDTDPGIDDALALLYAWRSPDMDVRAVTTVAGNVPVDVATANVLRLAALARAGVPRVAAGAAKPLARALTTATHYHGEDGLGDVGGWPAIHAEPVGADAVDVLVAAAREHGPSLTLVALGPLTNVAMAVQRDAGAVRGVGRVVVMGGAVDVPGNVTPTAEFNVHVDPEAAAIVLDAGLPLDLVPLDATRQAVLDRARFETAAARSRAPGASQLVRCTARGFRVDHARGTHGMVLHDPLAVGAALDPTLIEWEPVKVTVSSAGETRRVRGRPNCRVARRVDADRFIMTFLERLLP
ncbi:MAG: nucleoside hydrolase [Candidatus Rokubacteria bacterium]|nr:nucleoside hydrolase [Candidatus Rokubacteria bacterium]